MNKRISVIDSHTGGEPTRVVIDGFPDLGTGSLVDRRTLINQEYNGLRSAIVNEPRGSDVVVGALLCPPTDPNCTTGVIFFNNVGTINMCVHGTIGVMVTLAHLGRISTGRHQLETPVGIVTATLEDSSRVTVENVPSYRYRSGVSVNVDGYGTVIGDIAWGGNWFFLVNDHGEDIQLDNVERLTDISWRIRQALTKHNITGRDGQIIDHIELFGPGSSGADSKNFVLCPGKAYDRSPCGTGTSAKLACLIADGKLAAGQSWRQESIIGSVFKGYVTMEGEQLIPHIQGQAFVTAEATLILQDDDPYRLGIRG